MKIASTNMMLAIFYNGKIDENDFPFFLDSDYMVAYYTWCIDKLKRFQL